MFGSKPQARGSFGSLVLTALLIVLLAGCTPAATPAAAPTQAAPTTAPTVVQQAPTAVPPTAAPTATIPPATPTEEPATPTAEPTAEPTATEEATGEPAGTAVETPETGGEAAPGGGAPTGTAPEVTHPVAGREACVACHAAKTGQIPAPDNHEGLPEDLCLGCHSAADAEALAAPEDPEPEYCLACHGPFEQLAERTAGYTTENGEEANPHMYAPHDSKTITSCDSCHSVHPLPVPTDFEFEQANLNYCYGACHHNNDFTPCVDCHEEMREDE